MQARFEHATEEILEFYSLGTLPEADTEVLEEHLLICSECQERLTEMDVYVRHMQAAADKLRTESPRRQAGLVGSIPGVFAWPAPVWAAVVVICLLGLGWAFVGRKSLLPVQSAPIAVALQAIRGVEDASTASVPEGHPLTLEADLTGLPAEEFLEMELVDAGGHPAQRSGVKPEGGRVVLPIPSGLSEGTYWVRLYTGGPRNELLREYALRVQQAGRP
jgi:hypothetical protein